MIEEYGEERACAIFKSLYQRNKSSIRVIDLDEKEELAQLLEATSSLLASSALVKEQGHFAAHSLFKEGRITIQDESSQLVAPALDLQGDEWVLDCLLYTSWRVILLLSKQTQPFICQTIV